MATQQLVNGKNVTIRFSDGRAGLVVVKKLTIREIYQFVEYATKDQTPDIVAMCCGQDLEWVDTLDEDSFAELAEICVSENFTRAMKIAKRDPVIAAKLVPIANAFGKMTIAAVELARNAGEISSALSAAHALSESVAETGSESSITSPVDSSPSSGSASG